MESPRSSWWTTRRVCAVKHFVLYAFPKGIPAVTAGYDSNSHYLAYEPTLHTARPQADGNILNFDKKFKGWQYIFIFTND